MAEVNKEVFKTNTPSQNAPVSNQDSGASAGKVKDTLGEKSKKLVSGLWEEVIKPALIDLAFNAGVDAMSRIAYGDRRGAPKNSSVGKIAGTDYNAQYRGTQDFRNNQTPVKKKSLEVRTYRAIVFNNRMDCDNVLTELKDHIYKYGRVNMNILYQNEVVETILRNSGYLLDSNPSLHEWGWTDLSNVDPRAVRDGWILNLPDPVRVKP
jgi:hypothetical protein